MYFLQFVSSNFKYPFYNKTQVKLLKFKSNIIINKFILRNIMNKIDFYKLDLNTINGYLMIWFDNK